MKVATSVTYKTASLRDMERGIDLYNHGLYGCVKNPDLDDRARRMFADGLGPTREKILEQVRFIGKNYGGVAGHPAALDLAPDIADDIYRWRAEYANAAGSESDILLHIPTRATIEALYNPFVKRLEHKHRVWKNWLVWGAKFWHHLNPPAFPIEDGRVDDFFMIDDVPSVDKYMKLARLFRDFVLAHQEWLPRMREVDADAYDILCADNKLWDKAFYGLGE